MIEEKRPAAVFAPHVETATGIILSEEYLKSVSQAVHAVGGIFVLDCIASGTVWIDMKEYGVDVLISAPQKGWSGPACCGLVMLGEKAYELVQTTQPSSFSLNLKKWLEVMEKYEAGSFMYYTTLPTDSLAVFNSVLKETSDYGFDKIKEDFWALGRKVREGLEQRGFKSVAAEGWKAPGVVVSYSQDATLVGKFKEQGIQIAAGVPFKIDEPEGLVTFRIGLFGLDKVGDVDGTVQALMRAVDVILERTA